MTGTAAPQQVASTSLPLQQQIPANEEPRQENTTVCLPIVYGSIAFPLPKTEEYNTHRWTLYVRGPNNEDLSQVTEKGWGEFEASIRIVWRDPAEKALVFMHMIKLYPPVAENLPGSETGVDDTKSEDKKKKPVVHEFYDEVVFTDPTASFYNQLMSSNVNSENGEVPKVESNEPQVQDTFKPYSDENDFKCLLEAQKFLENELASVKDRILRADCSRTELDAALIEVTAKAKALSAPPPAAASPAPAKRKKPSGGGGSKKSKTSK
ncbi:hypothetical protein CTEN210_05984 [Chaetoceros tenuissimus]|uniref:YEATS domain-containing protein n=1 Tax=Chaetoceros tenuissimus TaxID=426638 RepID=A0AAD3CP18_9STRA|nr:hypothetical protein CTEN210_05984 [Chaetoceros tenuissimus]